MDWMPRPNLLLRSTVARLGRFVAFLVLVLVLGGLGILSCKDPIPRECKRLAGSLCIQLSFADDPDAGINTGPEVKDLLLSLDVRVGQSCTTEESQCLLGVGADGPGMPSRPAGCSNSCRRTPIPSQAYDTMPRMVSAEIDLLGFQGPGEVVARLSQGGRCLVQGRAEFSTTSLGMDEGGLVKVILDKGLCPPPPPPKKCTDHVDCGGTLFAQICDPEKKICVDPPMGVCPEGMVLIPAGSLRLGNTGALSEAEKPCSVEKIHRITHPLCVDRTEVTVGKLKDYFSRCMGPFCTPPGPGKTECTYNATQGAMEPKVEDRAANCVLHEQAEAYCRTVTHSFAGWTAKGRLPTEAEWEWFSGRGQRIFPWSLDQSPVGQELCEFANGSPLGNACETKLSPPIRPPGGTPKGNTPSAPSAAWPAQPIHDLSGNVSEWVADAAPDTLHSYCDLAPLDNPVRNAGTRWVYRGGSYADLTNSLRTFSRFSIGTAQATQEAEYKRIGFRCVLVPNL